MTQNSNQGMGITWLKRKMIHYRSSSPRLPKATGTPTAGSAPGANSDGDNWLKRKNEGHWRKVPRSLSALTGSRLLHTICIRGEQSRAEQSKERERKRKTRFTSGWVRWQRLSREKTWCVPTWLHRNAKFGHPYWWVIEHATLMTRESEVFLTDSKIEQRLCHLESKTFHKYNNPLFLMIASLFLREPVFTCQALFHRNSKMQNATPQFMRH